MPLDLQFYTLFVMVVTGIVAGFTYDFFRVLRRLTYSRGFVGDLWDLFFWVVVAAIVSMGLVFGNWGDLRLSVLLGVLIGVWFYMELASDIVTDALTGLFLLIARSVRFLYYWTLTIIVLPFNLFLGVILWVVEVVLDVATLLLSFIAWLFRPFWVWIYPHIEPKVGFYRHRIGPYLHWLKQILR